MPEVVRRTLLATVALSAWMAPSVASARHDVWTSAPNVTVDDSTGPAPEPSTPEPEPDSTTPESTPATSEPDPSTPTPSQDDALIGAGDPDSDVNPTTSTIAIVGFVLVIALAGWWMVRRSNPDAAPMPRPRPESPPSDLI
jgi:hypothetical protein